MGHLVELAPPNIYDAKYVKWSIADLPILPQKWQYLVSASTKKQFGILQKLMHRPDVDSIPFPVCGCPAWKKTLSARAFRNSNRQLNTTRCTMQHSAGNVPTGWSVSMRPGFFRACTVNRWRWGVL